MGGTLVIENVNVVYLLPHLRIGCRGVACLAWTSKGEEWIKGEGFKKGLKGVKRGLSTPKMIKEEKSEGKRGDQHYKD